MYGDEAGEFVCIYTEATVFTHCFSCALSLQKRQEKKFSHTEWS